MTFECSACHMRYRIDESILPRGGARVRCRQCNTMILIPAPAVIPPPANLDLIPPVEPPRPRSAAPQAPTSAPAPAARPSTPVNAPDWLQLDMQPETPVPATPVAPRPAPVAPRPAPVAPPAAPAPAPAWQQAPPAPAPARAPAPAPAPEWQQAVPSPAPAWQQAPPAPAPTPAPAWQQAPPSQPAWQEPPPPSEPVGGMAVVGEEGFDSIGVERFTPAAPPPSTGRDPAFEDIGLSVARFGTGQAPGAPEQAPAIPRLETESMVQPPAYAPPPPSYAPPAPPAPAYAPPAAPPPPAAAAPVQPVTPPPPPTPVVPPAPPQTPPPSYSMPTEVSTASGNVVPLTLGTPIPDGLPPDERARHEKARRLARVLASDIAIYNREKKDRGMQEGNLVAVLGYEIKKSWETYKERVGAEFANSTPYFRDALNDMLAEGKKVF